MTTRIRSGHSGPGTITIAVRPVVVSVFLMALVPAVSPAAQDTNDRLDALLKQLKTGDAATTYKAAGRIPAAAQASGDYKRAVPALMERLDDWRQVMIIGGGSTTGSYVHSAAKRALVAIGKPAVPALLTRLRSIKKESRSVGDQCTIEALGQIGDPGAVDPLVGYVRRRDMNFRRPAMAALGSIGGKKAWDTLADLLEREKGPLRLSAARGLVEIDAAKAKKLIIPHVNTMLAYPDARVKRGTMNLLTRCKMTEAPRGLVTLLHDKDASVMKTAVFTLKYVPAPAGALPRLVELAENKATGEQALAAIKVISDPKAIKGLLKLTRSGNAGVRGAATKALGNLKNPEAVPELTALLNDGDRTVRWNALFAISEIPGSEAQKALYAATKNEDEKLSKMAEGFLMKRTGPAAVNLAQDMLADPDPNIRKNAAVTLAEAHKSNRDAVNRLLAAIEDPDKKVRSAAAFALGRIGSRRALLPLVGALHRERAPASMHTFENPGAYYISAISRLTKAHEQNPDRWYTWLLGKMTATGSRDPDTLIGEGGFALLKEMSTYESTGEKDFRRRALDLLTAQSVDKQRAAVMAIGLLGNEADLRQLKAIKTDDADVQRDVKTAVRWIEKEAAAAGSTTVARPKNNPKKTTRKPEKKPAPRKTTPVKTAPPPPLNATVKMIVYGSSPRAFINNKMVKVGDRIGQWTVKAIRRAEVIVTWREHEQRLNVSR